MTLIKSKIAIVNNILAGLFIITLLSCSAKKESAGEMEIDAVKSDTVVLTANQFKTATIELGRIERRTLSSTLKTSGKLDVPPQNMVSVSAPFGGFLQSTEMLQGKQVRRGERIAVIQNPEYIQLQQDYIDNKSQLEFQKAEFERQEALAKENVNAQKSLQQAKASYHSKLAVVNGLHAKLKLINIDFSALDRGEIVSTINLYSPINGFITDVNFNIGSFLNPTDILFKIVDTGHLHAELTVFEKDVSRIMKGQKVRFVLAGSDVERSATVYLIGREISADRTIRIHCHLDKEETDLLPGMYLNAIIELRDHPVKALPESAVVAFEGKHYIFVEGKTPKEFQRVDVTAGVKESGFVEVTVDDSRVNDSTNVVVRGAYTLLSKIENSEEE